MISKSKFIDILGGTRINQWKSFVNESQYWPIEKQIQYQNAELRKLIRHAYQNVQYYKELFDSIHLRPEDFIGIKDLKFIPVLNKSIISNNSSKLLATNSSSYSPQYRSTGGTTGVPLRYYSDQNSWNLHWALKYRAWEWGGYSIGKKIGLIGGASIIPDRKVTIKRNVWNFLNGFYPLPSSHVSSAEMLKFAKLIKTKSIRYLRGYPSSIANFADFCLKNSIILQIETTITTAEVLRMEHKDLIKKAFNCLIIDSYGCADGGGNANTCEYDSGFHVSFEASIWEVCDNLGNPTPEGDTGDITLTSLTNYAMPLIRYQPGDIIENTFDYSVCSCGRTLPRIKEIHGRSTDTLKFSNGRSLGGPAFTLLFREFPVDQYQLIQNNLSELDINIIPSQSFNSNHELRLMELMQYHCGREVIIKLNRVNDIALPKSGKHRFIINNTK